MSSQDVAIPVVEPPQNLPCNVFAGSDIGYLKGIHLGSKSFRNLNPIKKLNKKLGISCLCWGNDDESVLYAGCRGGDLIHHTVETGISDFFERDNADGDENLKEICVHDGKIISAFQNGSITINKVDFGSVVKTFQVDHLSSLSDANKNLLCMDYNKSDLQKIATGGQENPLRVWDINNLSADPIFTAKNVRNDWLNLRVPVWVTKVKFYPLSEKIVTGTGLGKVRMYDLATPQRRPVLEIKCEEYPVTALAVMSNADHQVIVGNTMGTLFSVDLRKKGIVRAFKGNKGGITDIKCHPEYPAFAVSSVDRYVRCYDPNKRSSLHSFYLNSSLNCLLLSSKWDTQDQIDVKNEDKGKSKEVGSGENSEDDDQEDSGNEEEDVWNDLEEVQKKKRRKE